MNDQLNFFGNEKFKIDKPIQLIELFAGYGSQKLAFNYLGVPCESIAISEWCVSSIFAYNDLHCGGKECINYAKDMSKDDLINYFEEHAISFDGETPATKEKLQNRKLSYLQEIYNASKNSKNLLSICGIHGQDLKFDTTKNCVVMVYSFPCTDLSIAGKQKLMDRGSNTRSAMLWEVERILKERKESNLDLPTVLLMENVTQVHGSKNAHNFAEWILFLESLGYTSFYKDLNAKDYGIPQNRDRCFMVSILDKNAKYTFPNEIPLKTKLQDLLENNVDEKYYLSEKMIAYISATETKTFSLTNATINKSIARPITTEEGTKRAGTSNYIGDNLPEEFDLSKIGVKTYQTQLGQAEEEVLTDTVGILLSKQGKKIEKETEISATLMARDYKGFGNQAMTGVLEKTIRRKDNK